MNVFVTALSNAFCSSIHISNQISQDQGEERMVIRDAFRDTTEMYEGDKFIRPKEETPFDGDYDVDSRDFQIGLRDERVCFSTSIPIIFIDSLCYSCRLWNRT